MQTAPLDPAILGPDLAPPPGKCLVVMGQDKPSVFEYLRVSGHRPHGFATYTSASTADGLSCPHDSGGGLMHAAEVARTLPGAILQLGVHLGADLPGYARGVHDRALRQLGLWLQAFGGPIYLRIGYEFDFPGNGYEPAEYRQAYRHIITFLRNMGLERTAAVWHSFARAPLPRWLDWYPGDDVVDWFGVSYFDQSDGEPDRFAQLASDHGKPVMIAEAAPWKIPITSDQRAWREWFEPMFDYIARHDIALLSYISCDWDQLPMFAHEKWGDNRLTADAWTMEQWLQRVAGERFKLSPQESQLEVTAS